MQAEVCAQKQQEIYLKIIIIIIINQKKHHKCLFTDVRAEVHLSEHTWLI